MGSWRRGAAVPFLCFLLFIADLVARRASPETGGEFTTRNTVSRTSAVAGRTKLPWGRRERQADGSAAGGHPHFFRELHRLPERPATHHPASPDARSREPSPSHDRGANAPALSRSETLQDRASGIRGGWVRCASGRHRRRRMMGMSMGGPQKMRMAPCRASPPVPTLGFACSGHPAGRRLNSVGVPSPGSPAPTTSLSCLPRPARRGTVVA